MKITAFEAVPFEATVDRFGLGEPLPGRTVVQTLTRVLTDDGAAGSYLGGHFHGDQDGLLPGEQALITRFVGPLLAGLDPRSNPSRPCTRAEGNAASRRGRRPVPCPLPGRTPVRPGAFRPPGP